MKYHLEENDLVLEGGLVHRVAWTSSRSFDGLCGNIIDNYQPAHLLEMNADEPDYKLDDDVAKWVDPNEPITCLVCFVLDDRPRVRMNNAWVFDP